MELFYRQDPRSRLVRRIVDVVVSGSALVVAAPVLLAGAVAIVADDRGPVFFAQRRVGRHGRLFTIYKLRTMRTDAGDRLKPTSGADPRITRVGRLLRKTSIDELPQLFNVLRGDMTLVGPRPEMPFVVRGYQNWQHLRHLVTPGITGLWQTECRSTVPLHEPAATRLDIEYIRRSSPLFDLKMIVRTFGSLVSTRGAI